MTSATHTIIDGKATSEALLAELKLEVQAILAEGKGIPALTVIIAGDDPASQVYVKKKVRIAAELGLHSELRRLPADCSQAQLCHEIDALNQDPLVHGILVQLPLPAQINSDAILERIAPEKDVDGFHPINVGKLNAGLQPVALPCTPAGVITLLKHYNIPIAGQHAVILGRSNIVGKPMAALLLAENATVTICHSKTKDLPSFIRQADILVAALGKAEFVQADWVKPGAVVIDVGINRNTEGKLVGDVDYATVSEIASFITPVPGGVGPMTVATLMQNTLNCFKASSL